MKKINPKFLGGALQSQLFLKHYVAPPNHNSSDTIHYEVYTLKDEIWSFLDALN